MKVELESAQAWEALRKQIEAHGGAMVPCVGSELPAPFSEEVVGFFLHGRLLAKGRGQVVHVAHDKREVALMFAGAVRDQLAVVTAEERVPEPETAREAELTPARAAEEDDLGADDFAGECVADDPEDLAATDDFAAADFAADDFAADDFAADDFDDDDFDEDEQLDEDGLVFTATHSRAGGHTGEALWKRYQAMSLREKIHLASHGSRAERRQVLKDRDSSLHLYVLTNPGLTAQEIVSLLGVGALTAPFIRDLCKRKQWLGNPVVREALVAHPLTPLEVAVQLCKVVSHNTLRKMVRTGNARAQVLAAARRELR